MVFDSNSIDNSCTIMMLQVFMFETFITFREPCKH